MPRPNLLNSFNSHANHTSPLILVGMHRSGTSFAARWLHACGVHLGDALLGADPVSNPHGHYEDLDFLRLQEAWLHALGTDWQVTNEPIPTQNFFEEAAQLLQQKPSAALHPGQPWGWKDPRTCLFLHVWKQCLPNAKYWIVFRDYHTVVRSLEARSRNNKTNLKNNVKWALRAAHYRNKYLRIWSRYNQDILSFLDTMPKAHVLVTEFPTWLEHHSKISAYMQHTWRLNMQPTSAANIYTPSTQELPKHRLNPTAENHARNILRQLRQHAADTLTRI